MLLSYQHKFVLHTLTIRSLKPLKMSLIALGVSQLVNISL